MIEGAIYFLACQLLLKDFDGAAIIYTNMIPISFCEKYDEHEEIESGCNDGMQQWKLRHCFRQGSWRPA